MMLERIEKLHPAKALDVGCGCGSFTAQASSHCKSIIGIDNSARLIERCNTENSQLNASYACMDARKLGFDDRSFDLVYERASLHHIFDWQRALIEMMRVSSKHVLVWEPLDDTRSEAKRNSLYGQSIFLEIQKAAGIEHYRHIPLESLVGYFEDRSIPIEVKIARTDELLDNDYFFDSIDIFIEKTDRPDYWRDRLAAVKRELEGKDLCDWDSVMISAGK